MGVCVWVLKFMGAFLVLVAGMMPQAYPNLVIHLIARQGMRGLTLSMKPGPKSLSISATLDNLQGLKKPDPNPRPQIRV